MPILSTCEERDTAFDILSSQGDPHPDVVAMAIIRGEGMYCEYKPNQPLERRWRVRTSNGGPALGGRGSTLALALEACYEEMRRRGMDV